MLEISHLTIRYANRSKPAVSDLSLRVNKGEFALLVGGSASGKSTAMQAVCGFIPSIIPAEMSGETSLNGKRYTESTEISRLVCMVQQDPEGQFCTETVEEEVAFGPENFNLPAADIRRRVEESLRSVQAEHLIERELTTLSGGEKQKVAIASMLAMDPELIILDEPTASLDPRSVAEVLRAIDVLRKRSGITTIVVEHRVQGFSSMCDRLIVMEGGKLIKDCTKGAADFSATLELLSEPIHYPKIERRNGICVSVNDISFGIEGKQILSNVSFEAAEGSVTALMGENGAGKTTLLRLMMGLARPTGGSIGICGHTISEGSKGDPWVLGRDVGMVFQNPNHQIFESSVEMEILFASENFAVSEVEARTAAEAFASSEGVSKGIHPYCLSYGQKRRLNILSSSSHGPKLLLMDEPFVGQDAKNAKLIAELIARLQSAGKTVIVVTHNPDFARRFCTDFVILSGGRLVSAGDMKGLGEPALRAMVSEAAR